MTALATRDDVTIDGEIVEQHNPLTLFGSDDPAVVVERATRVATVLADVIKQRHLSARIGGRDHIMLEGWTLLGSMTGVFGEIEWTRPIERGWEARAVARTMSGVTVGAAEAMCTRAERTWSQRDEYAIRSMAQTRALSKALRLPLGFIVELAGFAATPAEEMDGVTEQSEPRPRGERPSARQAHAGTRTSAPTSSDLREQLAKAMTAHHIDLDALERIADEIGVPKGQKATDAQLRAMIARIESPPAAVPAAAGEGADVSRASDEVQPGLVPSPAAPTLDDVLAATGGELIPPRPGNPDYKALATGTERAAARAYWERQKAADGSQETLAAALGSPMEPNA